MNPIVQEFFEEIGLGAASDVVKMQIGAQISNIIEKRAFLRAIEMVPVVQRDEVRSAYESGDMDKVSEVFAEHVSDIGGLLEEEFTKIRGEVEGMVKDLVNEGV
jgi:hypothetical protein